jgi:F-type H+-transporting ATPase subunit alpha
VLIIFAGGNGYLDPLPASEVRRFEEELFRFVEARRPTVLQGLAEKKQIDDALREEMHGVLKEFANEFSGSLKAAVA